jgi:hypothetical protein
MLKQLQHSGIKRTIITGNKFLKRVGENFFAAFQIANQSWNLGSWTGRRCILRFGDFVIS